MIVVEWKKLSEVVTELIEFSNWCYDNNEGNYSEVKAKAKQIY